MSSSDQPEGPVTSEQFLQNNPLPAAATAAPTANPAAPDLNAQGRITPSQRFLLLRGVLWVSFLIFGLINLLLPAYFRLRDGSQMGATAALGVSGVVVLGVLGVNATLLIDLARGKVSRTKGRWSERTVGWGRNKRTIRTIGPVKVQPNVFMLFGSFSQGKDYIVYYLPISHVVVAYNAVGPQAAKSESDGAAQKRVMVTEIILGGAALLVMLALVIVRVIAAVSAS